MTRHAKFILVLVSASLLMMIQGCESKNQIQDPGQADSAEKQIDPEILNPAPSPTEIILTPGHEPASKGILAPDGYGGGSQGSLQPIATGNADDDSKRVKGRQCGNGIQEALLNTNKCLDQLYSSKTPELNGPSTLVRLNPVNGQDSPIGLITNIHEVTALDFGSDGNLYGIGEANETQGDIEQDQSVFAQINCRTGAGTIIGPTHIEDVESGSTVTDISFNGKGQLIAFVKTPSLGTYAGPLNVFSGLFTALPNATGDIHQKGHGITFLTFLNSALYHADEQDLGIIDLMTGIQVSATSIIYPAVLTHAPRIIAMDFDPFSDKIYVLIQQDSPPTLLFGVLNLANETVSLVTIPPNEVAIGLNTLAVNFAFEECDTAGDTEGCINCELRETRCNDSEVDDDFDGLTNCADADCLGRACLDSNICTTNEICLASPPDAAGAVALCLGEPVACDDGNPCTIDICNEESLQDPHSKDQIDGCTFMNDEGLENELGGCEMDGNVCTVGKCVPSNPQNENSAFICHEEDRKFIQDNVFGCKDGNQCTADSCIPFCETNVPGSDAAPALCNLVTVEDENGNLKPARPWQCLNEVLEDTVCFVENECRPGICTITGTGEPDLEFKAECLALPSASPLALCPEDQDFNVCTFNACVEGLGCIQQFTEIGVSCETFNQCLIEAECNGLGQCTGLPNDGASCNDFNECTVSDTCDESTCTGTPAPNGTPCDLFFNRCFASRCQEGFCERDESISLCDDENPCTIDTCDDVNACFNQSLADNTPAGGPCTIPDAQGVCAEGAFVCLDGEVSDRCASLYVASDEVCNGLDDDCNGLIDDLPEGGLCTKTIFITTEDIDGVGGADEK